MHLNREVEILFRRILRFPLLLFVPFRKVGKQDISERREDIFAALRGREGLTFFHPLAQNKKVAKADGKPTRMNRVRTRPTFRAVGRRPIKKKKK